MQQKSQNLLANVEYSKTEKQNLVSDRDNIVCNDYLMSDPSDQDSRG